MQRRIFLLGTVAALAPQLPARAAPFVWPAAHDTGYLNAPGFPGFLTPYTGAADFRDIPAGTRFEFIDFTGMTVYRPGVTFYGCRFRSNWTDGWNVKLDVEPGFGDAPTTFQWCTIEPLNATIPHPAWPSAGTEVDADGISPETYTPYMIPYADSYQYGILQYVGGLVVEDTDIWGFGNSISLFGAEPKTILRCWIHDASNPGGSAKEYHTDGPGYLNGGSCSNVLIKDCTIASFGNTNAIAFQVASEGGYQDIIVRHNYLSGFGYCVDMGHNAEGNARLQFVNNILATDISWAFGPLYSDVSEQFRQPGMIWSGNVLKVYPGSSNRPNAHPIWTAADDGKYVLPNCTYSFTDFVP